MSLGESDFNSIKVRLKPNILMKDVTLSLFQFHKGTIKTVQQTPPTLIHSHFNSIKVRLKQLGVDNALGFEVFQFHKGTIKTH